MKALAGDGLGAFYPADTAGGGQHCLGRALEEAPSSPPWPLPRTLHPGPLGPAWERREKLFASLLCSWVACYSHPGWGHSLTCQHSQGSKGRKPLTLSLSSALLCILRNHPVSRS